MVNGKRELEEEINFFYNYLQSSWFNKEIICKRRRRW